MTRLGSKAEWDWLNVSGLDVRVDFNRITSRASRSVAWIFKDGKNNGLPCRRTLTINWNVEIFRNNLVILNFLSFQSKNNFFNLSWDLTCRKWNWFSCNRGNIDRYSISSFIKNDHDHHSKIIMKDFEKMKNLTEFDRFDDSLKVPLSLQNDS